MGKLKIVCSCKAGLCEKFKHIIATLLYVIIIYESTFQIFLGFTIASDHYATIPIKTF